MNTELCRRLQPVIGGQENLPHHRWLQHAGQNPDRAASELPDQVIPLGMGGGVKPRSIRNEPDSRNPAFDRNGNTGDFDNKGWMDVDASATAQAIADCYS